MPDKNVVLFGVGVAAVLALVGYFAAKKIGEALPANAFNPLSDSNLAYRGANATVAAITGEPNATVGNVIWRLLNPGAAAIEDRITEPSAGLWTSTPYTPPAVVGGPSW